MTRMIPRVYKTCQTTHTHTQTGPSYEDSTASSGLVLIVGRKEGLCKCQHSRRGKVFHQKAPQGQAAPRGLQGSRAPDRSRFTGDLISSQPPEGGNQGRRGKRGLGPKTPCHPEKNNSFFLIIYFRRQTNLSHLSTKKPVPIPSKSLTTTHHRMTPFFLYQETI